MGEFNLSQFHDKKNTNLFRNSNIKIAFHTDYTISDILKTQTHNTNIHTQWRLPTGMPYMCSLSYVGQTGRRLELQFKEHILYITSNNPQSAYAFHINKHEYGHIDTAMSLSNQPAEDDKLILWNISVQNFSPAK
jgi:hypothetical protein